MEQQPHHQEDLPVAEAALAHERERLILKGLNDARLKGRRINDLTAKCIARELDPGSGSLHEFTETGAITDDIQADLASAEEVVRDLDLAHEPYGPWIAALREYLDGRLIRSAMPYWNDPSMD